MPAWDLSLTYSQALERIAHIAASYRTRGYGRGHRVALQLGNRPEFFLHFLALNSLGASIVPLNPDYRKADLEYVLQHSEACLVVDASLEDLSGLPPAPPPRDAGEGALLYTSATTGKPK